MPHQAPAVATSASPSTATPASTIGTTPTTRWSPATPTTWTSTRAAGPIPTGVHDPSSDVFRVESNILEPRTSEMRRHGRRGFLMTVGVGVREGADEARGGITVQPYASMREAANHIEHPVYFFSVDRAGRWHVDDHDAFGHLVANLDAGGIPPVGSSPVTDHVLQVRLDARTFDMTFVVDGLVVRTVRAPEFENYRVGLGVACSDDAENMRTCMSSFRDYRFEEWR